MRHGKRKQHTFTIAAHSGPMSEVSGPPILRCARHGGGLKASRLPTWQVAPPPPGACGLTHHKQGNVRHGVADDDVLRGAGAHMRGPYTALRRSSGSHTHTPCDRCRAYHPPPARKTFVAYVPQQRTAADPCVLTY